MARCPNLPWIARWLCVSVAAGALGSASFAASADVSFTKDIAPILAKKCVTCHGPEKAKGNYQLHNFETLLKPGASKTASVTPGHPAKSELFRLFVITDADDRMPQKDDPLPKPQIALIEKWIQQGAKFDGPDTKAHLASLNPRVPHPNPPASYAQHVPIAALAFSPDGKQLAASGYHETSPWEPMTGKLIRRVKNLPQRIQALAWHPQGQWLAVGGGSPGQSGEVALVDTAKGEVTKVFASTIDTVMALAFDKDCARLAAGGADNAIRLFSVPDGKELKLLQQHADWVLGLAFSPDGKHLASASRDRTARVFNLDTGELEASYMGHEAPVSGVAFSEDGKTVYSFGRDKDVHYWAAKDAKKGGKISGAEGELFRVLLAGDQVFSCGADARVRQHKLDNRSLVRALAGRGDRIYALAAHAPGKTLARLQVCISPPPRNNALMSSATDLNRRAFLGAAVAASASLANAATPRDWTGVNPTRYPDPDIVSLDKRFKAKLGNTPIQRLYHNPTMLWAEGCAWNGGGRYLVWSDIPNNRQFRWLEEDGHVSTFRSPAGNSNGNTFDFEGRQLACEHGNRRVVRYEQNGSVTVIADSFNGKRLNAPNDIVVHPDGGIWFTDPGYGAMMNYEGNKGPLEIKEAVYRVDPKTRQLAMVSDELSKPNGLCFSPDYKKLYIAHGNVFAWDVVDGVKLRGKRTLCTMAMGDKKGGADGIRCDVDGNIWAGAGWAGAGFDGAHCFTPEGERIGLILLPEICANLCFGGTKRNRLFMCGSTSLYAVYVETQGAHIC